MDDAKKITLGNVRRITVGKTRSVVVEIPEDLSIDALHALAGHVGKQVQVCLLPTSTVPAKKVDANQIGMNLQPAGEKMPWDVSEQ